VTLGESGKDVQHEDFRTKMREVRSSSSKGLDCFGLTARYVSPKRISALLLPLCSIIAETSSFKMLQRVDEVLRRIASGLNANTRLTPPELLILSHLDQSECQVSCRKYRSSKETSLARKPILSYNCNAKLSRTQTITQIIPSGESYYESIYLIFTHRAGSFVTFGLELFNTAFRRSRFDFQDKQIIARPDSFVKLIGNALYSSSEPVLIASLKASASILRCPLKSVPSSAPLTARQALAIIRSTGSGDSDVAQAGLKALTSILRKCEVALIKEKDLLFLIELVSPYLEDPDRQGTALPY
jgi:U3 small nucleolar RNA-associated protein 20